MDLSVGSRTDTGPRKMNQDHHGWWPELGLFVVADGMGGHNAGEVASHMAVDAIQACLTMDFDAGSQREIELFTDCVLSTESKAMRHLFFAEREAARIPDVPKDTPTLAIRPPRNLPGRKWMTSS